MTIHRLMIFATVFLTVVVVVQPAMLPAQETGTNQVIEFDPPYSRIAKVIVRRDVDRQDRIERFLLLAPGAPLVIEAAMTINGQPFRILREALIDEMLSQADHDRDGKPTWQEALASPRFTFARPPASAQQVQLYTKTYDKIENGLVDRAEARAYVAQNFQGSAFVLARSSGIGVTAGEPTNIRKFLDLDKDGVLAGEEIVKAGDRLKGRDVDDNNLLYAVELNGKQAASQELAFVLGSTADTDAIFAAIKEQYQDAGEVVGSGSFPVLPDLFKQLDMNKNRQLDKSEVVGFNKLQPHIKLVVDLGSTPETTKISLASVIADFEAAKESAGETILVKSPRFKVVFSADPAPTPTFNESTGDRYLQLYDKDENGYLDDKELTGGLARQFRIWDANRDGKVFAKDIVAANKWSQGPLQSQIRATSATQGDILFQALDETGDGRLSLREIGLAQQRIMTFDKNRDGQIHPDETPVTLTVAFGAGASRTRPAARVADRSKHVGPDWFVRSDRNGDGDVTLNEFLGSTELFNKLDKNKDGFIERSEADSASPP